ncbi:MAG: hypothetical protein ACOY3L_11850 [Pseudomonadota bacterium]
MASTTAVPADASSVVDPSDGTASTPALPAESGFAQAGAPPPVAALPADPATSSPADRAAPAPPDPSMLDPRERTRAFTQRDWRPQPDGTGFHPFGEDGLTFDDVIDVINPLQHIPIVSTVYRWLTGDKISPAAELAGGALFGGAIGLAGAAGSLVLDGLTGGETDQQVMVALFGPSPAGAPDGSGDGPGGTEDLAEAASPAAAQSAAAPSEAGGSASSRGAGLATATLLAMAPGETRPAAVQTSAAPVGSAAAALTLRPPTLPATPFPATMPTTPGEIAAPAPTAGLQPARSLKPLPPPLPPTTGLRQPPPIDTSGLSASLPMAIDAERPSAIPAAMTRALDSYRKLLEERDRAAVPVPGLDFQS